MMTVTVRYRGSIAKLGNNCVLIISDYNRALASLPHHLSTVFLDLFLNRNTFSDVITPSPPQSTPAHTPISSIHRTKTNYHTTHTTPVLTDHHHYYTTTRLRVQQKSKARSKRQQRINAAHTRLEARPRTHRNDILDAWLAANTQ